jgi:hypothetical protein
MKQYRSAVNTVRPDDDTSVNAIVAVAMMYHSAKSQNAARKGHVHAARL